MMALFAIWALLNGLDDLVVDLAFWWRWLLTRRRTGPPPAEDELAFTPRKRIAVFIPLWREHGVIRGMIEHNLSACRYDPCDFFIGLYPNDGETLAIARELEADYDNVHLSICPHDGPTSKADNLNWIYRRMRLLESERGAAFDIVITHDAEDLIHPAALRRVNHYIGRYDMVQIPVLPLPTPVSELLHGVYCDEFADYQSKELPVRQWMGGFLPSSGVGAGFSRAALERLAAAHGGFAFEPKCLTEDYENGFRIHRLGGAQLLVPIAGRAGSVVATRAYFPRTFGAAVKQRTRWMMGIALQSWELHGWRETMSQLYWFWRDRKGLAGALLSPPANAVFLYSAVEWHAAGSAAPFGDLLLSAAPGWIAGAFAFSMSLQVVHLAMRMRFSAAIYGWRFAAAAPARALVGNAVNFLAAACAIGRYFSAKWTGSALVWLKTEHAYPSAASLCEDPLMAEMPPVAPRPVAAEPAPALRRSAAS